MKYDDSKVCLAWLASASLSPKVTAALLDCFESPAELYSIFCSGKEKDIFNRLPEQALQILKKNSQKEKMLSFERIMKEEQIDVFHKILDCVIDTAAAEMRAAYKVGFKDGVALMREVQE